VNSEPLLKSMPSLSRLSRGGMINEMMPGSSRRNEKR
jgi:hypothetical protein